MPTFIKQKAGSSDNVSTEFIFGSRINGRVVDIKDESIVQLLPTFTGASNQIFTLYRRIGEVYAIKSPLNPLKVFDRWAAKNTINFYAPFHDAGNQRFLFSESNPFAQPFALLRDKRTTAIPFPPSPTSFTQPMLTETAPVFIEEILLPYPLVQNDLPANTQIQNTPFYKIVHSQYYRAASGNWDVTYLPGIEITHTIRVKSGLQLSRSTEVTQKLNISFASSGEISATIKVISIKAGMSVSAAFERTVKTVSSLSETFEKEETYSRKINVPVDTRIVTYQLTDYYEMYRMNETTPFLTWNVGTNQSTEVNYKGESSGGRVDADASLIQYILIDGKMVPISESESATVTQPAKQIATSETSVYPTLSDGNITISAKQRRYKSILINVYDQSGNLVYTESKRNTVLNATQLQLTNLPKGHYVVKIKADDETITRKIIRE
jgi:hypothetical protein